MLNDINRFLKLTLKESVGFILYRLGGLYLLKKSLKNENCFIIFNYHNFSKYNNYKVKRGNILETGYADNFEKQIRFYKKHFNFCYPEEYFNGKYTNGVNRLITFDDGYKDNYEIALPILKKYDASSVFFITTSVINSKKWLWHDKVRYLAQTNIINQYDTENQLKKLNQDYPENNIFKKETEALFKEEPSRLMMNWKEVKEMADNGFVIGAHTTNHKVLNSLEKKEQQYEIENSLCDIEQSLYEKPVHFAFPNGLYNQSTLDILKSNNIKFAYTTKSGYNREDTPSKLQLKRIGANASDSIGVLLIKLFINRNK